MRESGTYTLDELTFDIDGSRAYRYPNTVVSSALSGSWEASQEELDPDIQWVMEDELDALPDDEIGISPALLAQLWRKAQAYDRIMAVCVHVDRCVCE